MDQMSIFLCQRCDQMRDSDDGCVEGSNFGLICEQCMNEAEDDEETYTTSTSPAEEYDRVERMRAEMKEKMR
jgi:hypothetical protein